MGTPGSDLAIQIGIEQPTGLGTRAGHEVTVAVERDLSLAIAERQALGWTSMVVVFVRSPSMKIWISCDPGVSGCSSATHPSPTD